MHSLPLYIVVYILVGLSVISTMNILIPEEYEPTGAALGSWVLIWPMMVVGAIFALAAISLERGVYYLGVAGGKLTEYLEDAIKKPEEG